MNTTRMTPHASAGSYPPEERFGRQVASHLDRSDLGLDIKERLRVARDQALQLARVRRLALVPAQASQPNGGGTLTAGTSWWFRLSTVIPGLALAAGLYGISVWQESTQIRTAAELDVQLLSDDVPVDAYADPGFLEFLKESKR